MDTSSTSCYESCPSPGLCPRCIEATFTIENPYTYLDEEPPAVIIRTRKTTCPDSRDDSSEDESSSTDSSSTSSSSDSDSDNDSESKSDVISLKARTCTLPSLTKSRTF